MIASRIRLGRKPIIMEDNRVVPGVSYSDSRDDTCNTSTLDTPQIVNSYIPEYTTTRYTAKILHH